MEIFVTAFGGLEPCEQVDHLLDAAVLVGIYGSELALQVFLPEKAAVLAVDHQACSEEYLYKNWSSVQRFLETEAMRQPFSLLDENTSLALGEKPEGCKYLFDHDLQDLLHRRRRIYATHRKSEGTGFLGIPPGGMYGELARQKNLVYLSLHRCSCTLNDAPCKWVEVDYFNFASSIGVDVENHILPSLQVLFDEHLDRLAPP